MGGRMDLGIGGRHALVTGASKGIGAAVARGLAAAGAVVSAVARHPAPLESLARELDAEGLACEAVVGDVSTTEGVDALVTAVTRARPVEILVNNVGGGRPRPILSLTDRNW